MRIKFFKTLLTLIILFSISYISSAQCTFNTITGNGTSSNFRGLNPNFKGGASHFLLLSSELLPNSFANNDILKGIGGVFSTAPSVSTSGTLVIYLKNTNDVANNLSTTWSTAITGMTEVYNAVTTIGASTTWSVNFSTDFVYTGGGLYVAISWTNCNTAASNTVVSCNNTLTNGLKSGSNSTCAAVSSVSSSSFRPVVNFKKVGSEDIIIKNIWPQGKTAIGIGSQEAIQFSVQNKFSDTKDLTANLTVKDKITGTVRYTKDLSISLDQCTTSNSFFNGWIPLHQETDSIIISVSAATGEINVSNNRKGIEQIIDNVSASHTENNWTGTYSGVGFQTGSGCILAKYHITGKATVSKVKVNIWGGTSIGNTVYGVVLNSSGVIVGQSDNYVLQSADADNYVTFTIPQLPSFINEDMYVGLAQTSNATAYYPVRCQAEDPTKYNAFYTTNLGGGLPFYEYSYLARWMIEAEFTSDANLYASVYEQEIGYCQSSSFEVAYVALNYSINAGNIYNIELSNALGSFDSPIVIGTLTSSNPTGKILCTLPPNTPAGEGYRVRVTSSDIAAISPDNGIDITIYDYFAPGAILTTGETICYNGDPTEIGQSAAASGGDGLYTYEWQSSADVAFTSPNIISGSNSSTYNPPAGLTQTTWYRRLANDETCNPVLTNSTGIWQVNVIPQFNPGAIQTTGEAICAGNNPSSIGNSIAASGGSGTISYQWQSSTDEAFTSPTTISGSNAASYDPPIGLTVTTWYRRQAKDETCFLSFTNSTGAWKVTVAPNTLSIDNLTASNNNGYGITCNNGSNGSLDLTVSNGTTPYNYSWNSGETSQDLTNKIAGTYNVTVTDNNNCSQTSSASLTEPLPLPTFDASSPINLGENVTLSYSGGYMAPGTTAEWHSGSCSGTLIGTGNNLVVTPDCSTLYFLKFTGTCPSASCQDALINFISLPGTVTVGAGGDYPTLTGAGGFFEELNNATISGNIVAKIISDITEPGTIALSQWNECGAGNYTISIEPDGTSLRTLSCTSLGSNNPMISINGADRVTINGNAGKYLTLRNANGNAAYTGATVMFSNGSTNCSVQNCNIESNARTSTLGAVTIGNGTNQVTISNNNILNNTVGTINSPAVGIYSNTSTNLLTITNNNIYNWKAFSGTGYGVYLNAVANGCTITGNSFYYNLSTASSLAQTAIYLNSGGSHTISNNYIGGQSANCGGAYFINSGAITFTAIQLNTDNTLVSTVQNNTIQNINLTSTGSANFYAINMQGGALNILNNTIGHASTANSIKIAGMGTVNCIYSYNGGITNINNNLISNVAQTLAGSAYTFNGIYLSKNATKNVKANILYNLGPTSAATGSYDIIGINVVNSASGGYIYTMSNNAICMAYGISNKYAYRGIVDNSSTGNNAYYYYNSVYVGGTGTGTTATYAISKINKSNSTIKNNIFVNARTGGTGKNYAIYNNCQGGTFTCDNNLFKTSVTPLALYAIFDKNTLADWQTAALCDYHSISVDPQFAGLPSNMYINYNNNGGTVISSITTDIVSTVRSITTPDIGAYENTAIPMTQNESNSGSEYSETFNGITTINMNNVVIFAANNVIHVQHAQNSEVHVYSITGQLIHSAYTGASDDFEINVNVNSGYFFVRVINPQILENKKIFIN